MPLAGKEVIEKVKDEIMGARGTRIWDDYINALKLIAQVVFTRSSGFILELLQNAEDAGLGLENPGLFKIRINQDRVKVVHNGRLFSEDDVKALCGIRSSKKPEKGMLGYLGIGFKSVFKGTDRPEIYSGGFHFKFNRNHKEWGDPSITPWHVLPIWIDEPSESVDADRTTFIIPFREKTYYPSLLEELGQLSTQIYLFLSWLKRIEIVDEVSGRTWTLENVGESKDGITILKHDGQQQRFKFFRRTLIDIPDWVKQDRLTQEYRANVTQREITIAFALDEEGNLAPQKAGAMYGGVYSFLPLGEAKSGAKFPIQADFLVQPGREAINYEAKWNHWLLREVTDLCKEAIDSFRKHDKWKYQILPAFEFTKSKGLESYDRLFGPELIEPLERFLEDNECVPTTDGAWARPGQVVRLSEDQDATEDLVTMDILGRNEIASVLGEEPGLKLAAPEVKERETAPFKKVDRQNLLGNKALLEKKCQKPDAAKWFRSLYGWLQKHPVWNVYQAYNNYRVKRKEYMTHWLGLDRRTYRASMELYHNFEIVLTADMKLHKGGDVSILDLPASADPLLKNLATSLQTSKQILHPDILGGAKDDDERKGIRGFLTGLAGVQILDTKTVCREALLPKILTSAATKPAVTDLKDITALCQQILGDDLGKGIELWVLTKTGDVRPAKEVLFSKEFQPEQDWETNQKYISGANFVSSDYVVGITDAGQLRAWGDFFEAGGVNEAPDNGVEEFALNYAEEKLKSSYTNVKRVDKRNFGYDLEVVTPTGEKMCVEVKGQSREGDAELTDNETEAADTLKASYYLCVVSPIPENPAIYLVNNPAQVVEVQKIVLPIRIPLSIWKTHKWP